MPRRKIIDDALILATYARLQNGRAVARETKVHENTVYQVLRRAGGVCLRCGEKPVLGKTQCQKCLDFDKARVKQERLRRMRAGICTECDQPRSALSILYCDTHRIAAAARRSTYKRRQTLLRGSPQGEAQNLRQKMRGLLERFGPAGQARWEHANGACEICGTQYGDEAIHVHHVDQDQKNRAFENLICLCHTCHVATHAILRAKRRPDLLAWVAQTYPVS